MTSIPEPIDKSGRRKAVVEEALKVFSSVMANPGVRLEDNFIEVGGDSLTALEIAERLAELMKVPVEPADLLEVEEIGTVIRKLLAIAENHGYS